MTRKATQDVHDQIRNALEPYVRSHGVSNLADDMGTSQPDVSRWLRGDYRWSVNKLFAAAHACDVRVIDLLDECA